MTHRPLLLALAACTAAAAVSSAAGASTAKQQFTITTTTVAGKNSPTRVLADGAINGRGTVDVKSSHDSQIDHMTLHLGKGTVFLVAVEKSYAVHPDQAKCLATALGRGTFTITGGTRSFRGAHGSGTYLRHGVLYGAHNTAGACLGRNAPMTKTTLRVNMIGTVSLG